MCHILVILDGNKIAPKLCNVNDFISFISADIDNRHDSSVGRRHMCHQSRRTCEASSLIIMALAQVAASSCLLLGCQLYLLEVRNFYRVC